jgi:RNA polymerase sigma-70 factor (ECF subfamily)
MGELLPRAMRAAGGVRGAEHLTDELASGLTHKLLVGADGKAPKINDYAGRGSLASWLCAAAIRTAVNLRPGATSHRLAPGLLQQRIAAEDPELHLIKARYRPVFKAALIEAFDALEPEERSLLRMSLVEEVGIDRLAVMLGAHRSTVARRLVRIRERLVKSTKDRLEERFALRGGELDSLVRAVRSELSVSVSQLFDR